MTEKSGTATNSQFAQVLYALSCATATAIEGLAIGNLIRSLNVNGPKLKEYLGLVFQAIASGQKLVLRELDLSDFPVWKTIQRGTMSPHKLLRALDKAGCRVYPAALRLMRSRAFTVAPSPVEVDLVLITPAMIGFAGKTAYSIICARVLEIGLELCQPEDGPLLRIQHSERLMSEEFLAIMMKGIVGMNQEREVFWVARQDGGELNLGTWGGNRDYEYRSNDVLVCVKPRAV